VSPLVLATLHYTINRLVRIAERAERNATTDTAIKAYDAAGKLSLRELDFTQGKSRLNINFNLRGQERLPDYRALPEPARRELDRQLDAHADEILEAETERPDLGGAQA
jgi:hypothetical protein